MTRKKTKFKKIFKLLNFFAEIVLKFLIPKSSLKLLKKKEKTHPNTKFSHCSINHWRLKRGALELVPELGSFSKCSVIGVKTREFVKTR